MGKRSMSAKVRRDLAQYDREKRVEQLRALIQEKVEAERAKLSKQRRAERRAAARTSAKAEE